MDDELRNVLPIILFVIVLLIGSVIYAHWQFQLCYPEVSDSWWYCFQHAVGN